MALGSVCYPRESERENQVPNHATCVVILRAMVLSPLLVELQWPEKRRTDLFKSLGYPCGAGAGAGLAVHQIVI